MRLWLLKLLLRWYRGELESQIDVESWDKEVSGRLDAVAILLDD